MNIIDLSGTAAFMSGHGDAVRREFFGGRTSIGNRMIYHTEAETAAQVRGLCFSQA